MQAESGNFAELALVAYYAFVISFPAACFAGFACATLSLGLLYCFRAITGRRSYRAFCAGACFTALASVTTFLLLYAHFSRSL